MRILLIQPPWHPDSVVIGGVLEPLALETVAATLSGHEVEILDMRFERDLESRLKNFRPDCVGITAITMEVPGALEILRIVRNHDRKIIRVVGGHHATLIPQDFPENSADYLVIGPGEQTFKELCGSLEAHSDISSIPGLAFWRNGQLAFTRQREISGRMSSMPLPRRDLTAKYKKHYKLFGFLRAAVMITSQGCPYRCTFCALWKINQGKYLGRSPEEVVKEIESIQESTIFLGDDNTFGMRQRIMAIHDLIVEKKIKKTFYAYARADSIVRDADIFEKWARIGLKALVVGFEAVEDSELKGLNKESSVDINSSANEIMLKLGIDNWAHFIMMPHYRKDSFDKIWRYIESHQIINIALPFYTPFPGTDLYEQELKRLVTKEFQFFDLAHPLVPTSLSLSDYYEEVEGIIRKTYSLGRYWKALVTGKRRNPLLIYLLIPFMVRHIRVPIERFIKKYGGSEGSVTEAMK